MKTIKNKFAIWAENQIFVDGMSSVVSVILGLFIGLIIMLLVNPSEAFQGFYIILRGGSYQGMFSIGQMIYTAVPLVLTGLSIAFAFKTGLFNIGATGQMTMGAFVAVYIGVKAEFLSSVPFIHWGTAVIGAIIAGAIWGAIPGLLKAYRNVNEVVSSIMLNYIAMYLNVFLVKEFVYNKEIAKARAILPSAETPTWGLENIFKSIDQNYSNVTLYSSINIGIFVAIITVLVLHIILYKTTFGYELKAVGFNRDASKYAGMNEKRNIVFAMMISGGVAGLAGAMFFLNGGVNLAAEDVLLPQGFTGIAISLLGLNTPIGVFFAALFYGSLAQGGFYVQLYTFKPEIIEIIIAIIIYFSALSLFLRKYIVVALTKRKANEQTLASPKEGSDK